MARVFLFGYGSLINQESRSMTGNAALGVPVMVQDIQRGWFYRNELRKYTVLGTVRNLGSICSGVLFEIPAAELEKFDRRESDYDRIELAHDTVCGQNVLLESTDLVYTYVLPHPGNSSKEYPVPLSYVRVVLDGCFAISEEFAATFCQTTVDWNVSWLDDSSMPIYPRPLLAAPQRPAIANTIVKLLLPERQVTLATYRSDVGK